MPNQRIPGKPDADEPTLKLAVLIDADNAQSSVIESLLGEIARFGEATVKRIYGDFTAPTSAQWKKVLNRHAIKPVQQFAYTTGKNATDSTLIIDAMDLLYTRRFDGFCLVSSDSDFTGLAVRIREEGLMVFGFGQQKTPEAFRNSCHKFIFTEVLGRDVPRPSEAAPEPAARSRRGSRAAAQKPAAQPAREVKEFPRDFMLEALEKACDDSGWANLGTFGTFLNKLQPDFDSRLYGYKKLSDLVRAKPAIFICEERGDFSAGTGQLYVRAKAGD